MKMCQKGAKYLIFEKLKLTIRKTDAKVNLEISYRKRLYIIKMCT